MQIRVTADCESGVRKMPDEGGSDIVTATRDPQENSPTQVMNYELESKKPITAKLKSLRQGDSVTFPIERRQSVYAVASRLKKELVRWAWNFKLIDNTENFTVTIVRIS